MVNWMSDTKKVDEKWFLDQPRHPFYLGGEGSFSYYLLNIKAHSEFKPIRRLVFNELPKRWSVREKLCLAILVSKCACEARWHIQQHHHERCRPALINKIFSDQSKFRKATEVLLGGLSDRHNAANASVSYAIERTGITREQFNLAMETLEVAALSSDDRAYKRKKQISKNHIKEKGLFDVLLGEQLINHKLARKRAAKICAMIRAKYPYLATYASSEEEQQVVDLKKETKAIEQRLRDNGL